MKVILEDDFQFGVEVEFAMLAVERSAVTF
jgi:hypothetical protein